MDLIEDTENRFSRLKSCVDGLLADALLDERVYLKPASEILRQCVNMTQNTKNFYSEVDEQLEFMALYKKRQLLIEGTDDLPRFAETVLEDFEALAVMSELTEPNFGTFENMGERVRRIVESGGRVNPEARDVPFPFMPAADYIENNWKTVLHKRNYNNEDIEDEFSSVLDLEFNDEEGDPHEEGDSDEEFEHNDFLLGNKYAYL